jgi:hypothetical protein
LQRGRSVSRSLLNQQAFRLEKNFEVEPRLPSTHSTIPGYLELCSKLS